MSSGRGDSGDNTAATSGATTPGDVGPRWSARTELLVLAGAVLLGAVLIVLTSVNQPYNQNEWAQIEPYGSNDPGEIVNGTRQPPLDPLLGGGVQHLLGEGQLRQRLVPMLAGLGSLVLMAGLVRRMRLGLSGALALYVMATAPLFLRYSAYIRPYALPVLLMLLCSYAGLRWLDEGRRRWLVAATVGALLLPLSRVPEPVAFLGSSAVVLAWVGWRRRAPRRRAWALGGCLFAALATVGVLVFRDLQSQTSGQVFDSDPGRALGRVDFGAQEVATYVLPLLGDWFPWWPVTVVLLVLAVVLGAARRRLASAWFWWPLVLAPLVFLVAFHTINPHDFEVRHYRVRFAYFFVPPFVLLVAAVGDALWTTARGRVRWLGPALVALLLVSQLPRTYEVLTENDSVDYAAAGDRLGELPEDAVVVYDSPSTGWRQPFSGAQRYLADGPETLVVSHLAKGRNADIDSDGPVYLLLLDSECAPTVVCGEPRVPWSGEVEGYRAVDRFDRFTLYEPTAGQQGTDGVLTALRSLTEAYGLTYAEADVEAELHLLWRLEGRRAVLERKAELCDRYDAEAILGTPCASIGP